MKILDIVRVYVRCALVVLFFGDLFMRVMPILDFICIGYIAFEFISFLLIGEL